MNRRHQNRVAGQAHFGVDDDDRRGMDLENIIDEAIKKNKAVRRQTRQEKGGNQEVSRSPDRGPNESSGSPSTNILRRRASRHRKPYEEPDML